MSHDEPVVRAESPVVSAEDIVKRYGDGAAEKVAVDRVSLSVDDGEFVAILGPSGCGKSTLLGIIGCLDRSFEGHLKLFGQDVRAMRETELAALRGRRIGFVFQAFHLLGHVNARDNVLAPTLFSRDTHDPAAMRKRADEMLKEVGLEGRGDDMPSTLSGGERQRLAVARALLLEPDLLLCDEPTGNLDLATGRSVTELFLRLHRERGLTILAVTHEEQLADAASRIIRLSAGRVVAHEVQRDPPDDVAAHGVAPSSEAPSVRDLFDEEGGVQASES